MHLYNVYLATLELIMSRRMKLMGEGSFFLRKWVRGAWENGSDFLLHGTGLGRRRHDNLGLMKFILGQLSGRNTSMG
jgi:hypothetical protein